MTPVHKTKALAISCIDFRFQKIINQDLTDREFDGQFDRIALPGASKEHDFVIKACDVSIRLHDPDQVLIYEHQDCGAYDQDDSEENHRKNAQKLADSLKMIKPAIKVTTLLATFDGIKEL